jgi:hypothetical protein
MGEKRTAYRSLVRKPEGKRPLGRQRRRWVNIIELDLAEIDWAGLVWLRTPGHKHVSKGNIENPHILRPTEHRSSVQNVNYLKR